MAVLLTGRNGNEFELGLVHESLSDKHDDVGDTHWATVNFRVASESESWEESAPCLNLYEFQNLADWLEAVGSDGGGPDSTEIELLQPELSFSVSQQTAEAVTLRIRFQVIGRPEEFDVDSPTDEAEYVDLHVDRPNILSAARELKALIQEITDANMETDPKAEDRSGLMGLPDEDLNAIHRVVESPGGMTFDEDTGYVRDDRKDKDSEK